MKAFQDEQPIRLGTCETDAQADFCIHALWNISSHLQEGSGLPEQIIEPVSHSPYAVETRNGDNVVACTSLQPSLLSQSTSQAIHSFWVVMRVRTATP